MMKSFSFGGKVALAALFLAAFILLTNFTLAFKPKLRYDAQQSDYTALDDIWNTKPGNKKLVILLHGMYSNPKTFLELSNLLVENGWDVYMPALPAGAHTLQELKNVGPWAWKESLHFAREKILLQKDKYEQTILGGHSQGGALTLALAPEMDFVSAFLSIAGPVNLYGEHLPFSDNMGIFFSGLLCLFIPQGAAFAPDNTAARRAVERVEEMEKLIFPYTIFTFKHGLEGVRKNLKNIHAPLFLAYEKGDETVGFHNFYHITKHVSSKKISAHIFNIPRKEEPYGHRHDLLWYSLTKDSLNTEILLFLSEL
ncbi:MAG: alpha/beta hydrolase [Spirochaetia bacterium]